MNLVGLELGTAGRKPTGSDKGKTAGRNRWETRELTVFPAKAWFRGSPWDGLIQTVLRLERTVCKRDPATGLCKQTTEVVFSVFFRFQRDARALERMDSRALAH